MFLLFKNVLINSKSDTASFGIHRSIFSTATYIFSGLYNAKNALSSFITLHTLSSPEKTVFMNNKQQTFNNCTCIKPYKNAAITF